MAILFPPGFRLSDADGNPLSGAKVRVRVANSETLASLYSDAALSSSISNPVITDAAGYPANGGNECVIYCASGTYDVAFLDSSDNVLASFDDVSPYGAESSDIERTVTGNGRFKVTGSAGAVMIQVGDPSPDNTGGTLTIEGQAGTQGDTLTLDFATVNTTGTLTENGKKLPGVVYTDATTPTPATSIDIALPEVPANCRAWRVDIWDISLSGASGGGLQLQFSFDNGATYKSGASDYAYGCQQTNGSTQVDDAATLIYLSAAVHSYTNKFGWVSLEILTPESGSGPTLVKSDVMAFNNTTATESGFIATAMGACIGGYGRATHARLTSAGGNTITCKYRVQPLRGFGD
jgi:hypothetical protein